MNLVFTEDQSRIRSWDGSKNISLLRRLTHNLLQTSLELAGKSVRSRHLASALGHGVTTGLRGVFRWIYTAGGSNTV